MKTSESKQDLRERTKCFALRIIHLAAALPKSAVGNVISYQILKSGTSVGAHYREASRSRSTAEFISKMEGGLQELDETAYWLELLADSGILPAKRLAELRKETDELIAIFTTCVRNAKRKKGVTR
ncbi:MAG: four helix bundle protein [Thermoguttaceae bacterium]|jgi:four helix bundle protein